MTWLRLPTLRRDTSDATTCPTCALRWYPSARHQSCPGCEAKRGRELREVIEAALMRLRSDRSARR